jgi:hypothetical protein
MKRLLLVVPVILAACGAETTAPTVPKVDLTLQLSDRAPPTITNQNFSYSSALLWLGSCANQFVTGTLDVHWQTQRTTYADGTQRVVQHINSAGGKATDVNGVEYVFKDMQRSSDDILLPDAYEGVMTISLRLISMGRELNEFIDVTVHYSWDGQTYQFTQSYAQNCRGSGGFTP